MGEVYAEHHSKARRVATIAALGGIAAFIMHDTEACFPVPDAAFEQVVDTQVAAELITDWMNYASDRQTGTVK